MLEVGSFEGRSTCYLIEHQAPDVLCDALLAFRLVRVGGFIGFDDMWQEPLPTVDILRCPKTAIDAFVNIYRAKLTLIPCPSAE